MCASSTEYLEYGLWKAGYRFVGGIDEAGRGPLAGPLVASCVVLSPSFPLTHVPDAKRLTSVKRREFFEVICREAVCVTLGIVGERLIDCLGIQRANAFALYEAAWRASSLGRCEYFIVDWLPIAWSFTPCLFLPHAEEKSLAVACASVVAKVFRDYLMETWYDALFPDYGFAQHKGYGTAMHFARLKTLGPSPCHRKSFCKE
nr:ribonuclease HII [Candidatus Calescibacterium sp.]